MRHWRKRVFNGFAMLLLLLLGAAMALWVGAYRQLRGVEWNREPSYIKVESAMGSIVVSWSSDLGYGHDIRLLELPSPEDRLGYWPDRTFLGFGYQAADPVHREYPNAVQIPYWIVVIGLAIIPVRQLWLVVGKRSKANNGLCSSCGYDLRATPDRCPECGRAVTKVSAGK
jgi:hypothetical protein